LAAAALYQVLKRFDPAVQAVGSLDLAQTYENKFVEQASLHPR
jgi:hypothetical protein